MNTPTDRPAHLGRIGYQNAVLTAIAVLLGVGLVERSAGTGASITEPAGALAQSDPPEGGGMTNRLEQNKQMIAELRTMNGRLERIEAKLSGRLDVRVTDMPPIKLPPEARTKPEPKPEIKPEPKPDSKPAEGGK